MANHRFSAVILQKIINFLGVFTEHKDVGLGKFYNDYRVPEVLTDLVSRKISYL